MLFSPQFGVLLIFYATPSPNKPAPFKYKFLLGTTAWEGKQLGMEEGIWPRGVKNKERADGKKKGKRSGIVTATPVKCHHCAWLWQWSLRARLWLRRRRCVALEAAVWMYYYFCTNVLNKSLYHVKKNGLLWLNCVHVLLCCDYSVNPRD